MSSNLGGVSYFGKEIEFGVLGSNSIVCVNGVPFPPPHRRFVFSSSIDVQFKLRHSLKRKAKRAVMKRGVKNEVVFN